MSADQLAFVDTETTGLDPDRHQIWEVALIVDDEEYEWFLPVDLSRADPVALNIGRFHDRYTLPGIYSGPSRHLENVVSQIAELTRGRHLVGAVVSFDEERLRKLLRENGECPMWHYHLIDVEALAVGYLWRKVAENVEAGYNDSIEPSLPWDSEDVSFSVGVDPDDFDRHTALGDARWAKAIYEAVTS